MYYLTIDCGTTNSRVYLVNESGAILDKITRHIGVRTTSITGSNATLKENLTQMIASLRAAHPEAVPIQAIVSSGMITSEIGLKELAHLPAPCGIDELAAGLTEVDGLGLTEDEIPVYFIRGIKSKPKEADITPFEAVKQADFMRGEETQVMGMLKQGRMRLPAIVLVLSSHSKWIPVSSEGKILGSLTTASGQVYASILEGSFVGKSVTAKTGNDPEPADYFDESIVESALQSTQRDGLVRSTMFPRFLDVLFETKWYERKLFFNAAVAADDFMVLKDVLRDLTGQPEFYLIGQPERCRLYSFLLQQTIPTGRVTVLSDEDMVDELSIDGALEIARRANIIVP